MSLKTFLALSFVALLLALILIRPMRTEKPVVSEEPVINQINDYNAANSSILSISCTISAIGSKTEVLYIKPSKFMAITNSMFGKKQAEVATDGIEYWFWMRDFDKDSLYHCPLHKVSSTRVIFPMRPAILVSVLGVNEIKWESISMYEGEVRLTCLEEDLLKCVLFKDGKMTSIIYYKDTNPVMTATFKSYQIIDGFNIPKNFSIFWHEQKMSLDLEMKDVVVNIKKPQEIRMPEGMRKVSLVDF